MKIFVNQIFIPLGVALLAILFSTNYVSIREF